MKEGVIVKDESGNVDRRQVTVWPVKEIGLYSKVSGKPVGKWQGLISLLEKVAAGAVENGLEELARKPIKSLW